MVCGHCRPRGAELLVPLLLALVGALVGAPASLASASAALPSEGATTSLTHDAARLGNDSAGPLASTATTCTGAANAITYTYDKNNNRKSEVRAGTVGNPGTLTSTYNAADQLTQTVIGATTTLFSYDANGNRTGDGTRTYTFDLADRPTSTTAGAATTSYAYDGDGNRIQSTTSAGADLRYWWDTLAATGTPELVLERTPTGTLTRRYVNGPDGPLSQTTSAGVSYYHRGWLDSISDVTASAGTAQWAYTYEPYGAARSATATGTPPENRARFTGQYLDPETSLYNLRARAYDPARGRFDGLDPLDNPLDKASSSAYAYALARPTALVDPTGLIDVPTRFDPAHPVEPSPGTEAFLKGYISGGVDLVGGLAQTVRHPIASARAVAASARAAYARGGNPATGVAYAAGEVSGALPLARSAAACAHGDFEACGGVGFDATLAAITGGAGSLSEGAVARLCPVGRAGQGVGLAAEDVPAVVFSRSAAPGLAQNFDRAVANGAPTRLNRVSASARDANRRAALRGHDPAPAGMSLDEYPFACSAQGGAGACVSVVPVAEQSYQGGVLSSFFQNNGVGAGDPFRVMFGP